MAADDAHQYTGDETKSYLMVQADELSRDAILEAIAQGRFYASQGPRFWIEKKDNSLIVHSTPGEGNRLFHGCGMVGRSRDSRGMRGRSRL